MFEGFTEFNITIDGGIIIHGIKSGTGPPLLLLHGFPQTHHIWHKVAPQLSETFTVVAIDLRGYGQSSKPASTAAENHRPYSKSVMAQDCASIMTSLGFSKFLLCSHDRGARVAHKICVDHPGRVIKVMFLDVCPTLSMFEKTNQAFSTAYWHWFFLIQPTPLPEKLIRENIPLFTDKFLGGGMGGPFIDEKAKAEYVRGFHSEEGVHAMCEEYRAAATIDLVEAREDKEKGRKIQCPIKILWGKRGIIQIMFDAIQEWKDVSDAEVSGAAVDSGHYIPEQVPDELVKHAEEFFGGSQA